MAKSRPLGVQFGRARSGSPGVHTGTSGWCTMWYLRPRLAVRSGLGGCQGSGGLCWALGVGLMALLVAENAQIARFRTLLERYRTSLKNLWGISHSRAGLDFRRLYR